MSLSMLVPSYGKVVCVCVCSKQEHNAMILQLSLLLICLLLINLPIVHKFHTSQDPLYQRIFFVSGRYFVRTVRASCCEGESAVCISRHTHSTLSLHWQCTVTHSQLQREMELCCCYLCLRSVSVVATGATYAHMVSKHYCMYL